MFRRPQFPVRLLAIVLIASLAATVACLGDHDPSNTKVSPMLNTTPSGNPQANAYLPVAGTLGADLLWSRQAGTAPDEHHPLHLALAGDRVFVQHPRRLEALSRDGGKEQWVQPVPTAYRFQMSDQGIGTMSPVGQFVLYGLDGQEQMAVRLPLSASSGHLLAWQRLGDELRYAYSTAPSPVNAPGQEADRPSIRYRRLACDQRQTLWRHKRTDSPVDALTATDGTVYLVGSRGIDRFPADASDQASVTEITGGLFEAAVLDHDNQLVVVVRTEEGRFLKKLADGREAWSTPIGEGALGRQPLGCAPDDHVYLQQDSSLAHYRAGQLVWTYDLPAVGDDDGVHFTVLSDRTVLVASATLLVHVREDGQEQARVLVSSPLTCRPVMDGSGRVYVGTRAWVGCYE